jgi:hypothetical protein
MSFEEVIKEQGDYRVILIADEYPDEPYDDGQSPLLRIGPGGRSEHVQVGGRPTEADEYIEAAVQRWGGPNSGDWNLVEKYLRAFHGVTQIETYYSGNYWYATYDSAEWRSYTGTEPGSASMAEYKAWIVGDVWSYAIQKRVPWATEDDDYADRSTWEDVDSCSGLYGHQWAEQAAREAFETEMAVVSL